MAATAPPSSAAFLDLLRRSNILTADRWKALPAADELPPEPNKAAAILVRKGFVTKFQATQLLAGRHKGFRVGQHVIRDMLGRGGMGAVYLAEHLDLNRKVAIKILAPGKGEDQRLALERFLREARAAAALDHPNIVRIFDVGRHNDTPFLVMEFVDGETLQQALDRAGTIPPAFAAECIAQAAAGLQHAHEKGFIHRDIKPANLIRDRFGAVKILDMGLARSGNDRDKLTEQLDEGAVVGTADFISPEQAINCPTVDARADIYSLGATLFTLIVGKTPFEGNTTQKLMQHQLRTAPNLCDLDPQVPADLAAVVAKMLAKKPGDRYQSAADVVAALAAWTATSTHVLAGLTRTNLGASASSPALQERVESSRRLLGSRAPSDSAIDTSQSGKPTGVLSSEVTLSDPSVPAPKLEPEPAPKRRHGPLIAGIAAALVVACGALVWLAFGRDKSPEATNPPKPDTTAQAPAPPVNPQPRPNPPVAPPQPKPPADDRVVFKLDADDVPEFKNTKTGRAKTGGDDDPQIHGVNLVGWKADSKSEWTCGPVEGAKAIGITNLNDVVSAQIGIELEHWAGATLVPGQAIRMRVTYRTAGTGRGAMYVQSATDYKVLARVELPNSNAEWKTLDLLATRGPHPVRCLVDTSEKGVGNTLFVRTVTVATVGAPAPVTATPALSAPPKVAPKADPSDLLTWTEGAPVYRLDVAAIPAFRVQKEKQQRLSGDEERLPPGIGCQCWKAGAVGDFRCEKLEGVPALGVTNLNDEQSGQYYFSLETEMNVTLQPGKAYRVKVGYRTANDATGNVMVQVTPGYKSIGSAQLSNTADQWKTATVSFVRPPGADKVDVRMVIDNTSVGEGNTLWIRSVEIVELTPPAKK